LGHEFEPLRDTNFHEYNQAEKTRENRNQSSDVRDQKIHATGKHGMAWKQLVLNEECRDVGM
jgi:hypothetical protein